MRSYDIIIYDDCSAPFTPRTAADRPLGGVEWTLMLLAQSLADDGLSVLVLTRGDGWLDRDRVRGRLEYDHVSRAFVAVLACEAVVVSRWSAPPPVAHRRMALSLHDIPDHWMFQRARRWLDDGRAVAVCVSEWLSRKIAAIDASWIRVVVPPMMVEACYERSDRRDADLFVCASAAVKGLPQTIDAWVLLQDLYPEVRLTRLLVATNGYDEPSPVDQARMAAANIQSIGQLTGRGIIEALRGAAGLFYVNTYPETFGIVPATALALGLRCHVLTLDDPGALPESLSRSPLLTSDRHRFIDQFVTRYRADTDWSTPLDRIPDRRPGALLPAWKKVLFDEHL